MNVREATRQIPADPNLRAERRLSLTSRNILLLLESRGRMEVGEIPAQIHEPFDHACIALGWLVRSRVVRLTEEGSGKLHVEIVRLQE